VAADWRIEPLRQEHDRGRFDCGEAALDEYLRRYARQNQDSGIAGSLLFTAWAWWADQHRGKSF